jgi:hypothetical protein
MLLVDEGRKQAGKDILFIINLLSSKATKGYGVAEVNKHKSNFGFVFNEKKFIHKNYVRNEVISWSKTENLTRKLTKSFKDKGLWPNTAKGNQAPY